MKVLVTGGAGYIGSTTATALEAAGHVPVVLDSLVTGRRAFVGERAFYHGDVADRALLARVFAEHPGIACTLHLAARVSVPESVARPLAYHRDNVAASVVLLDELRRLGRPAVVFSSSASVYAATGEEQVTEDSPVGPTSPYARGKLVVEQVLADSAAAGDLRSLVLRYFNPVGSDPGLTSGVQAPRPSHVLGQMIATALGQQEHFTLTGTDLPTRDGTGLRDYVHVWDLARAHVRAVEVFDEALDRAGADTAVVNLGTGRGVTVRELLAMVERAVGRPVPTVEAGARPGDPVGVYAAVERARRLLGWEAGLSVADGVDSALRWAARRDEVLGPD